MIPTTNNENDNEKKVLTPAQKKLLLAQLDDYTRVMSRQLGTYQKLLLLHIELISTVINDPKFQPYVIKCSTLMNQLKQ